MEMRQREFWWLLALEATLFLSAPCWELTAPWAEPVDHPFRFGVSVVVAATVAMFACHLGPAAFATRFGGPQHRISWIPLVWLGAGYLAWILSLARSVAVSTMPFRIAGENPSGHDWTWLGTAVVFLATVIIAAWVKPWWKPVVLGGLFLGAGILVWALATTWPGLWARNPYDSEGPLLFDWLIIKGMLLSAAPSVVIAWRIGRIEPEPRRIWLSGLAGVWLPLVVSVTIASLAAQAGANLHWVPSLSRGFNWALLGPEGRLTPGVMTLTSWTLLPPALLSAVSLRELVQSWPQAQKRWLVPIIACLVICGLISTTWHYGGIYSLAATPAHQFWAESLVVLGAAAGLAWLILAAFAIDE